MPNEAQFSVAGFVATKPFFSATKTGVSVISMRVAWTPRRVDRATGEWADAPTCFVTVKCYGRTAENCKNSLDKGDPVVVRGTLTMHDYESKQGTPRTSVDIAATSIGHDLSCGVAAFRRTRPRSERPADEDGQAAQGPEAAEDLGTEAIPAGPGTPVGPGPAGTGGDEFPDAGPAEAELAVMTDAADLTEHGREPVAAPF